jgi:glycosyltransferase involved in cell wall biosynthesis
LIWSILVCGIPERFHTVQPLLYSLMETQAVARMPDVELLYLLDSRRRSVGAKRNDLMAAARGEYVSFIDDDDEVAPDYVQRIYRTLVAARKQTPPVDVVCFRQRATLTPAGVIHDCTYSLAHWRSRPPEARRQLAMTPIPNTLAWSGPPAHTMVWRREVVGGIRFPEQNFGEDVGWVDAACARAASEVVLDGEPLYHYAFNEATTSTR